MADTTPMELRKCLRKHFTGKISRGDDGKQYRIKASDPLVQEIIAKVKEKPVGAELPTQSEADKGEGNKPSPESFSQDNESYSEEGNFSTEPDFTTNFSIALTQSNKPEVAGSNPAPATKENYGGRPSGLPLRLPRDIGSNFLPVGLAPCSSVGR